MIPESSKPGLSSEEIEYDQNTLNSQQEKQNIQNPKPIVQNIIIEEQDSRTLSDNILKQSNSKLIKPAGSIKKEQDNLTEQKSKIKKTVLSLPQETIIIRFEYNTNNITQEGFIKLKDFADIMMTHPDKNILIKGYTDSYGSLTYNRKLSEFRANIVRSFLLGSGIMLKRIQVKGLGGTNPIEDNNTSQGRKMNRRVEIEIIKE
jgi:general secretion pathway protein A